MRLSPPSWMNWPLDTDWVCEICGTRWLTWSLQHGICCCDTCHAQYTMRDKERICTRPQCLLKPDYHSAFKSLWSQLHKGIDEITDDEWDSVLAEWGR